MPSRSMAHPPRFCRPRLLREMKAKSTFPSSLAESKTAAGGGGRSLGNSVDGSVLALVDQRALLDPRHHVAKLGADLFDVVLGETRAGRLERGLVDLVLQHPVAGKAAGLNVREHALHL